MKILLLLLVTAVSIASQTKVPPCSIAYESSPAIRGLKLGMTMDAVNAVIAPLKLAANEEQTIFDREQIATIKGFDDVISLEIGFFRQDERFAYQLASLKVGYDPTQFEWTDIKQFAHSVSDTLHLPYQSFVFLNLPTEAAFLTCRGFVVTLETNRITLFGPEFPNPIRVVPRPTKPFKP